MARAIDNQLVQEAFNGDITGVRAALGGGADVNAKDDYGDIALVIAAVGEYVEIVRELLERGADVNAKDDDGDTALICAAYEGHVEVVRELLERGADVNINDTENGKNSLHYAICNVNEKISNNPEKDKDLQEYVDVLTALKPCYERNINMNFLRNAVTVAAIYGISSYFGNTRQAHACTFFAAFAIDSVFGMGVKNRAMHPSETFVYASALAASSITASMLVKNNVLKAVITILPAVAKNLYDEGSYYKQIIDIEKKLADYNTKNPERTVNY